MGLSATRDLPSELERENPRYQVAEALRLAERIAFSALIVLSPLRARLEIAERPNGTIYGDYTDFLLFWSDIAFIALLAFWVARLRLQPRQVWLTPHLIRWPVVGLVLAGWISVPFSFDASLSAYSALRLTAAVALGLYVANEVRSVREVLPAIAIMVAVQALVGIGQVVDQASLGLGGLGENDLDPEAFGTSIVWMEEAGKLLRGYGLTDHPNILGGLLACGLLIIGSGLSRAGHLASVALIAVFGLGVGGLVLSFSRSGELAFATGFVLVMALLAYRRSWPEARRWLVAGLVALVVGGICLLQFSDYIGSRVNPGSQLEGSPEQRAIDERSTLAKAANDIFSDRPATGVGIGALPVAMQDANPKFDYPYQPAHVVLLDVAAETGIFGAFFYAVTLIAPWVLLWHRRRQLTPELIGLSGALMAATVVSFFDYYTWSLAPGRIWAWLVLGLWLSAYWRTTRLDSDA